MADRLEECIDVAAKEVPSETSTVETSRQTHVLNATGVLPYIRTEC